MQHAVLELRLVGGYRMWWTTITPILAGHLKVVTAPEFFRVIDFLWQPAKGLGGHWDLWPIRQSCPTPLCSMSQPQDYH